MHDGAQQRLVTLALSVRLARRRIAADAPELDAELASAERELHAAVADLRELAHGLFPAVLDEEGLGAALEALTERAPRLVLGAMPDGRFSTQVESAVYFMVAETLRLVPTGDVTLDASLEGGDLVIDVRAESELARAPTRLEDRVGAVGGTLAAGADHLHVELPCAS